MSHPFDHLIHWFKKEKRDLPWRENPTPYAVWISEVMLQQTQVSVVIPYFERWMQRFPTIQCLAEASLEEVIKLWEGLGYYSRARNLHDGARAIVKFFDGNLPNNAEDLSKIKGLGDYTIGAILSFAFHQRVPAVDGNVIRVLTRYFSIEEDISKSKTKKALREKAFEILPQVEPWIMVEALIELGATVCQKKPKCSLCPLKQSCQAFSQGKTDLLPFKSTKVASQNLFRAVAVVISQNHLLIRKVQDKEIMAGLHEFPYFETGPHGLNKDQFKEAVQANLSIKTISAEVLANVKHSFTKYQVQLFPMQFTCSEKVDVEGYQWVSFNELDKIAFSSGHRRILALIKSI
jgi:A/G-specific adenine glycosylase